jgi:hypothetical protein
MVATSQLKAIQTYNQLGDSDTLNKIQSKVRQMQEVLLDTTRLLVVGDTKGW